MDEKISEMKITLSVVLCISGGGFESMTNKVAKAQKMRKLRTSSV